MKFLSAVVLSTLAASVSGFAPATPLNLPSTCRAHSPVSQLNMVAEDAKVVLVTGASRGLGAAIAKEIGSHGHKIVVNYAGSEAKALEVVEEIKKLGGDAIAVQADCSDLDSIKNMFKTIVDEFGSCDVLINNAGITKDGLVPRMKKEQWTSVIDTNLSGVFYTSQAFYNLNAKKKMSEGAGRIINISSIVGQIGQTGQANYSAAKAGVIGLAKSNAREFAARGVTVNVICPGFIKSDMTDELSEETAVSHVVNCM